LAKVEESDMWKSLRRESEEDQGKELTEPLITPFHPSAQIKVKDFKWGFVFCNLQQNFNQTSLSKSSRLLLSKLN